MAKKKKYTLLMETSVDFDMIGICTHHSDYRLAWGINDRLNIHLTKLDEDYVTYNKKGEEVSSHSMYGFYDKENRVDLFLVKNKSQGKYLIPEANTIDYFLFICENHSVDPEDLIRKLKQVNSILGAYSFEPEELSSAQNLVFS